MKPTRFLRAALSPAAAAWPDAFRSRYVLPVQTGICAILWSIVALHQGYDFDWDILNYHFYNGFALIHGRIFANVQPAMLQTYFAPLMDAVFYILVRLLPPTIVLVVVAVVQSLAFPILFRLARQVFGNDFGQGRWPTCMALLVTLLGAAAPVSLWEAGSPRGDTTTAPLVLAALLCVAGGMAQQGGVLPARRTALAGALAGLATALKLTNAPFALGLLAALMVPLPCLQGGAARLAWARAMAAFAAGMAISFLIGYGWWGLLLYRHLGNPVFPNFNQFFHSPYAMPDSYADFTFALPSWKDKFLFPFVRNSIFEPLDPAGLFDVRMALAVPLCALGLIAASWRSRAIGPAAARAGMAGTALLAFVLVSYLGWLFVFPVNRYLAAVDLVAPLACVVAVLQLWPNRAGASAAGLAMGVAMLASAYHTRQLHWLPGDHRHGDEGGYFGVSFNPPPGLDHAAVAMLSDRPISFVIPFFPRATIFVRLQGSLLYRSLGFNALNAHSTPQQRRAVFGNEMGVAICQRLDQHDNDLFLLHLAPADTPHDAAALAYFGLADAPGACTPIGNKANLGITLCPARRLPMPECRNG